MIINIMPLFQVQLNGEGDLHHGFTSVGTRIYQCCTSKTMMILLLGYLSMSTLKWRTKLISWEDKFLADGQPRKDQQSFSMIIVKDESTGSST